MKVVKVVVVVVVDHSGGSGGEGVVVMPRGWAGEDTGWVGAGRIMYDCISTNYLIHNE
jgi:hypothetical protein